MSEMSYTVIRKIIYDKYILARANDEIFNFEDYEWEIGAMLAYQIPRLCERSDDEMVTIYGIRVRLNHYNPNKIELWRKVK